MAVNTTKVATGLLFVSVLLAVVSYGTVGSLGPLSGLKSMETHIDSFGHRKTEILEDFDNEFSFWVCIWLGFICKCLGLLSALVGMVYRCKEKEDSCICQTISSILTFFSEMQHINSAIKRSCFDLAVRDLIGELAPKLTRISMAVWTISLIKFNDVCSSDRGSPQQQARILTSPNYSRFLPLTPSYNVHCDLMCLYIHVAFDDSSLIIKGTQKRREERKREGKRRKKEERRREEKRRKRREDKRGDDKK
ncbi:hypothetical protein PoB_003693800 [Plakobranchus ocellatus]|uniref:Transmembrane protein n=1 Tax=Plakobranchus ocellatus TaxID=259542 RepID=A0AAV4ASS8_9GAST|nr:hypothetical protein PoB_003693800 [Plakobranchus ocellatus]